MNRLRLLSLLMLAPWLPCQSFVTPVLGNPPHGAELLVYDSMRDRTVAFIDGSTWQHDGFTWGPVGTANSPSDRYEFAMTFDGQRVLLYGGQDNNYGARDDLWAFDGTDWTLLSSGVGPGRRRAAALAYDPVRGRVVLYGGTDMFGNFPNDTWEWDGATWTVSNAPSPGSRVWHRMVYDEARGRVVMCAGAMNPVVFVDTWEWDGTTWTQTVTTQFPYSLQPALVFDRSTQRTLAISGWETAWGYARPEVWAYDAPNATWTLEVPSTPPMGQWCGAAYDDHRERTIVLTSDPFFGSTYTHYYRDLAAAGASFTPYGVGCTGGNGQVPVLGAAPGSLPALGTQFTARVTNVGNALLAALGVGWSRLSWAGAPLPPSLAPFGFASCDLYMSPDVVLLMNLQTSTGEATLTWPIPNNATLRGVVFFEQALTLDLSAPNGLGAVSNACMGVAQ